MTRAKISCRNSETVLTIVDVRERDCCSPQSPPCSDFIASRLFSIHSRQKPQTKTKPKLSAQGKKNGNTITSPMFPDCACRNSSHAQSAPFLRHFPDTSVIKLKCSAFFFTFVYGVCSLHAGHCACSRRRGVRMFSVSSLAHLIEIHVSKYLTNEAV